MYDNRFKLWNVQKNCRSREPTQWPVQSKRPHMLQEIDVSVPIPKVNVSIKQQQDYHTVVVEPMTRINMSCSGFEDAVDSSCSDEDMRDGYMILTPEEDECMAGDENLPSAEPRPEQDLPRSTSSWVIVRNSEPTDCSGSMPHDEAYIRPLMKFGKFCSNDERVLTTVHTYFGMRLRGVPEDITGSSVLEIGASRESRRFWSDAENYFYLLKLKKAQHAPAHHAELSLLTGLQALAENMVIDEPFDFLRRLFTTLSPTNTQANLEQRLCLINGLRLACKRILGPFHPLTVICTALEQDENSPELSRYVLDTMSRMSIAHFGYEHAVSHKLSDSIIKLTRRSGDLPAARRLAEAALQISVDAHGSDSDQARSAAIELAHILTRCGEHDKALTLRQQIVTVRVEGDSPVLHGDGMAAHTMEDLAEYHVQHGSPAVAAMWLRRAETIARKVWPAESSSTMHIVEKLDGLLEQMGQSTSGTAVAI